MKWLESRSLGPKESYCEKVACLGHRSNSSLRLLGRQPFTCLKISKQKRRDECEVESYKNPKEHLSDRDGRHLVSCSKLSIHLCVAAHSTPHMDVRLVEQLWWSLWDSSVVMLHGWWRQLCKSGSRQPTSLGRVHHHSEQCRTWHLVGQQPAKRNIIGANVHALMYLREISIQV